MVSTLIANGILVLSFWELGGGLGLVVNPFLGYYALRHFFFSGGCLDQVKELRP